MSHIYYVLDTKFEKLKCKTHRYYVKSLHDNSLLGIVKWYPQWRCYVYQPLSLDVIWSPDCLQELSTHIKEWNIEHKEKLKKEKSKK